MNSVRIDYQTIDEVNQQTIYNEHNDNEILFSISGFRPNQTKTILYHILSLIFLGIPYVIFHSFPKLKASFLSKSPLRDAQLLLVCDMHENCSFEKIQTAIVKIPNNGPTALRFFFHQHTKYVWLEQTQEFGTLDSLIPSNTVDNYLNNTNGLLDVDYIDLLKIYGPNKINVQVKSYWRLFVEEVFTLFYLFQLFSVTLWFFDDYMIYAVCVIGLALLSSVTSLLQTRKQSQSVHDLVESSNCYDVNVLRQNLLIESYVQRIDPADLVPGDLIVLPAGNFVMPCDAVLLNGQCIVNESVLTGESVPVTKTALHSSNEIYNTNTHKRHTLFSGTTIIQTRFYGGEKILARVVRTGFDTTKGQLIKSILFPTPVGIHFYKDSLKFVAVLFLIALNGMIYCMYMYWIRNAPVREMIIRTLDIITIVVPPAMPAAMTIGIVYSQNRLKKLGIFCISPPRINLCGRVKLACFDKTGTLTHDGLNMSSVVPCVNKTFLEPISNCLTLDIKNKLVQAMAACHSLTRIDGQITGDPLDLNMFKFTKWEMEEPGDDENARFDMLAPIVVKPSPKAQPLIMIEDPELPYEIGIVRQFPFSSTLQCMSVIGRDLCTPHMTAFTKGAPEKLLEMCLPETIPNDYMTLLSQYTARGFRVIAIAYKELPKKFKWKEAQRTKRDVVECDLHFLGFLIMQNPLKSQTAPVIKTLHDANIRTVMITGDNILTAISVAMDCGMVNLTDKIYVISVDNSENPRLVIKEANVINCHQEDEVIDIDLAHCHFALDGKTWTKLKQYYPDLLPNILVSTKICARFQPDQKAQLITDFQKLDYVVSMVGDGANDCGALKAAHIGVSLSQAEASVAAPFTSSIEDISCLTNLILEGRCALVTSFAVFKYMALYSLIQFITILILYQNHSILGDFQFLFIDLIITTVLAMTIGLQGPAQKLTKRRPMSSLIGAKNVIPLILQILVCALIQAGALFYLFEQKWFEPIPSDSVNEVILSWENTVLFTVSCYQYVILATVYSKGRPYREMLITNFWFLVSALSLTSLITWMLIYPTKKLADIMEIIYLPHNRKGQEQNDFRYTLLAFPVTHFVVAVFIEVGIADRDWFKKLLQLIRCKRMPKNRYKFILQNYDQTWFNDYIVN